MIGDCERALGRPERAVALLDDPDVPGLEQAARVELVIVAAGARRDMGQPEAGVLLLQGPAQATTAARPWASRLWYAYADALLAAAGREDEAREWFSRTAEQDEQGQTDAVDRLLELDGLVFEDLHGDAAEDDAEDGAQEPEAVDLQALLAAPVPEPSPQGTDASPQDADVDVQPAVPDAVPAALAVADVPAAEGAEGAGEVPAEQPPAEDRAGPAAPGLFSHDEAPPLVAPRRAAVPVVSFSPPPGDPPSRTTSRPTPTRTSSARHAGPTPPDRSPTAGRTGPQARPGPGTGRSAARTVVRSPARSGPSRGSP